MGDETSFGIKKTLVLVIEGMPWEMTFVHFLEMVEFHLLVQHKNSGAYVVIFREIVNKKLSNIMPVGAHVFFQKKLGWRLYLNWIHVNFLVSF